MKFRDTIAYAQLVEAVWLHRRESNANAHVIARDNWRRDNPHQGRRRPR